MGGGGLETKYLGQISRVKSSANWHGVVRAEHLTEQVKKGHIRKM